MNMKYFIDPKQGDLNDSSESIQQAGNGNLDISSNEEGSDSPSSDVNDPTDPSYSEDSQEYIQGMEIGNLEEDLNLSPISDESDISDDSSDEATTDSSDEEDEPGGKNAESSESKLDPSNQKITKGSDKEDDDNDCESTNSEEAEATMEEIFGTKPNKEALKNHPPTLKTDSPILDICFHPESEILAAGNICGECALYRYSLDKVEEIKTFVPHDSSCRQICFNDNGSLIYTVSNDKSIAIIDLEGSVVKTQMKNAHDAAIYSFLEIHNNLFATGDDDGLVKLWDTRRQESVMEYQCSEETVTSLLTCGNNKFLSATCADGSLTGINIRKKKLEAQSEMFDSEFTCQSLVRTDSRLAVGSGSGIFYIFNWGDFGYNIDALSGHPDGIVCQAAITDRIVITGCNDGLIRATHLYPHRFLGIVGQHKDFSVDNIAVSNDGFILASCSNDDTIQFWNIEYLYEKRINPKRKANKAALVRRHLESSRRQNPKDFFKDIPKNVESDDEGGPVPGGSYDSD